MIEVGSIVKVKSQYLKYIKPVMVHKPMVVEAINGSQAVVYYIRNIPEGLEWTRDKESDVAFYHDLPKVRAVLFQVPVKYLEVAGERLQEII